MVEQMILAEVQYTLDYPQIEKLVIKMLSEYKEIEGKIRIREKQALGKDIGFYLDVNISSPFFKEDKLKPLHARLKKMKENDYLDDRELELLRTARKYIGDELPAGVRSQHFVIQNTRPEKEDDQIAMDVIAKKIERVVDARYSGIADMDDLIVKRIAAGEDAEKLRNQMELIDDILDTIKRTKPHFEKLLRTRFIEHNTVQQTYMSLNVSRRTYDRWKAQAITEFARKAWNWERGA